MRSPARAVSLLIALALAAAGCGGDPLGPSAATVADGTTVSAQRYLADSDEAAAAVSAFSDALARVGPVARPAALRALAPDLDTLVARARTAHGRLLAQRLEDARLESQRAEVAPLLGEVVAAMEQFAAEAGAGRAVLAAAAAERFSVAVEALRASRAPA
ncbi:MAG: hypothetical protein RJQ03_05335 [Miltoncostaeaceae bacterium]